MQIGSFAWTLLTESSVTALGSLSSLGLIYPRSRSAATTIPATVTRSVGHRQ
jgi:hypothetical protein